MPRHSRVGYAGSNGWTDSELFLHWLRHFVSVTNSSLDNLQIIILDGHRSHKTLEVVHHCRGNGIAMLILSPHSTHKLQPLKSAFNAEADSLMVANPGRRITVHVAVLSGKEFLRTALPLVFGHLIHMCSVTSTLKGLATDELMCDKKACIPDQPSSGNTSSSVGMQPIASASGERLVECASTHPRASLNMCCRRARRRTISLEQLRYLLTAACRRYRRLVIPSRPRLLPARSGKLSMAFLRCPKSQ